MKLSPAAQKFLSEQLGIKPKVKEEIAVTPILGDKKVVAGGVLGGKLPKPFKLRPVPPELHQTWADRLSWAENKFHANHEIRRDATQVTIRLLLDGGDTVIHAKAPSTGAAVELVLAKLEAMNKAGALGVKK